MDSLNKMNILIFVGNDYEDMELQYPKYRLLEAGAKVVIAGLEKDKTYYGKHGYPQLSQEKVANLNSKDFDGVIVPGGWMPDKLRRDPNVLQLVREIDNAGKCVASICHGPWINISSGVVKGKNYTSTSALKDDLTNAGAKWDDKPVIVDGNHISSRRPDDLPVFMIETLRVLKEQAQ